MLSTGVGTVPTDVCYLTVGTAIACEDRTSLSSVGSGKCRSAERAARRLLRLPRAA